MSKYVTFPIAKLLKEKGFGEQVNNYFRDNGRIEEFQPKYTCNYNSSVSVGLTHSRPNISDVVDWLSEKHGIWINVEPECYGENWYVKLMCCSQKTWENLELRSMINKATFSLDEEKSPKEAYLAAIEYTLKNLI